MSERASERDVERQRAREREPVRASERHTWGGAVDARTELRPLRRTSHQTDFPKIPEDRAATPKCNGVVSCRVLLRLAVRTWREAGVRGHVVDELRNGDFFLEALQELNGGQAGNRRLDKRGERLAELRAIEYRHQLRPRCCRGGGGGGSDATHQLRLLRGLSGGRRQQLWRRRWLRPYRPQK